MTLIWIGIISVLSIFSASAHEGGHGPRLSGTGPHGGKLSAVIAASEADQGTKAKIQGVAEWVQKGNQLTFYLRDEKGISLVSIPPASTVKWIVVDPRAPKPEVFRSLTEGSQSRFDFTFPADLLKRAQQVEVILPSQDSLPEDISNRRVFVVKLQ